MDDIKLREIKRCFRQTMNADLTNSIKAKGVVYRMNFGVPAPRIKLIAEKFDKNIEDAEYLWNEDVRESKMLATYLYPENTMDMATALRWCSEVKYIEIADQLSKNLLMNLSFALDLANILIGKTESVEQYIGYRLLINLIFLKHSEIQINEKLIASIKKTLLSDKNYLQNIVLNLTEKICESSDTNKSLFLDEIKDMKDSDNEKYRMFYDFVSTFLEY